MVEEIEDTIQQVTEESDNANKALSNLEEWDDDDLDKVLAEKKRFEALTKRLGVLNETTIGAFNDNQNEIYRLLPVMGLLHVTCIRNVERLSDSKIAKALRATIDGFQDEVDQLKENIDDFVLIHDALPADEEWQQLIKSL